MNYEQSEQKSEPEQPESEQPESEQQPEQLPESEPEQQPEPEQKRPIKNYPSGQTGGIILSNDSKATNLFKAKK